MFDNPPRFTFFGTDEFAATVLDELVQAGFIPAFIITAPDKKKGRGMKLTPPPVKLWAQAHGVPFLQPETLKDLKSKILHLKSNLFIVASYGKILPKEILAIPPHGTLNVHPSLLPLFRGPSPIQSQIFEGTETTGVTVMLMDEKIDHGPIVARTEIPMPEPLPSAGELTGILAREGGKLLAETIPAWLAKAVAPKEQDHAGATYTNILKKEDGLLEFADAPDVNYRKIRAYDPWPGAYFFAKKGGKKIRLVVKRASIKNDALVIERVVPEGKREMTYGDFLKTAGATR